MFPQGSSLLCPAILTVAALILSLSAARNVYAQAPPVPTGGAERYRQLGPVVPESFEAGGSQQRTSTGQSYSTPVLTPGYFEVVCPAICYGGAFHVCGKQAYAGAGYYGPFRRYWAYGTYGPSYNIGPDNSSQFGLYSGVMYVVTRRGHGISKHGGADGLPLACSADGTGALPIGGEANPPAQPAEGPTRRPAEKLLPPADNKAHLRLLVPENAEVLVEGGKTSTTGTVRDFISPPLTPGKNMTYSILVRYMDASGKTIEETHSLRVRANDQLLLDWTAPANAEQPHATVLRP
jgi:uncharacterized protein (TIGR03000 family)